MSVSQWIESEKFTIIQGSKMKWNLASEPPKKTNQYLVCIKYYDGEEQNGEILYCDVAFYVGGKWMLHNEPKGAKVTHWVEIPDWPC